MKGLNMNELPGASAGHDDATRKKIHIAVAARNLASASNNTKWNELINHFRQRQGWRSSYRSKSVTGNISGWDVEWFYHLTCPSTASLGLAALKDLWFAAPLVSARFVWTVFASAARAFRRFNVGDGYLTMLVCEAECL